MIFAVICMSLRQVWHLCNLPCVCALFWLISIARYVFRSSSICFLRDKIWRLLWTCSLTAFYIVTLDPAVIRTACTVGRLTSWISYLPSYVFRGHRSLENAIRFSREILMFLVAIWWSLCFWSSMYRFIPPLIVFVSQDSNVALSAQVCWLCCVLYMLLFDNYCWRMSIDDFFTEDKALVNKTFTKTSS